MNYKKKVTNGIKWIFDGHMLAVFCYDKIFEKNNLERKSLFYIHGHLDLPIEFGEKCITVV